MRELHYDEIVMLEGLYEEALGLPSDHEKISILDDDAYKSWNHRVKMLKKDRLITAPTNKQIMAGNAPPMAITAEGKAEYERIKGSPRHLAAVEAWRAEIERVRAARARSDAAYAPLTGTSKP